MTDQDQINERCCCLIIRGGKLTAKALAFAMRAFLAEVPAHIRQDKQISGKQSVKSLTKDGSKLESIEMGECVKRFERTAKKYAVDYAVIKDLSEDPPKHLVFFKSRDTASMTAAFREFSAKELYKSATKPTLKEALQKMAEQSKKQVPEQVKEKVQEAVR